MKISLRHHSSLCTLIGCQFKLEIVVIACKRPATISTLISQPQTKTLDDHPRISRDGVPAGTTLEEKMFTTSSHQFLNDLTVNKFIHLA